MTSYPVPIQPTASKWFLNVSERKYNRSAINLEKKVERAPFIIICQKQGKEIRSLNPIPLTQVLTHLNY